MTVRNVCLVGAGYISDIHAAVLGKIPNLRLHSVVDPRLPAARALAASHGIGEVYPSVAEAIAAGQIDCAHVLTPPDRHFETAAPFLEAGIDIFVEKPLAVSSAQCASLMETACEGRATLGVNQNFIYHPAFARLRDTVRSGALGPARYVNCLYNVALTQMSTKQFGHWMFRAPQNILLEQAVHPLSQLLALCGRIDAVSAIAGPSQEISEGVPFYSSIDLTLTSPLPGTLRMAVGQSFPFWQITVICDDGVAVADIAHNRFFTYRRSRWLDPVDYAVSGLATARSIAAHSLSNLRDYGLSTLRLRGRSDPFYLSMKDSIGAFHEALAQRKPAPVDAEFGARLVTLCEEAAGQVFTAPHAPRRPRQQGDYEVAVIGGTGFIGARVVKQLSEAGLRVGVMARNVQNLSPVFLHDNVTVRRGDMGSESDLSEFLGNSTTVIALAHGGGGQNYAEIRERMVGGAERIAQACLARKATRLIHIGSIAGLYLGPGLPPVTGATPPDPKPQQRADYSRAKVECDVMLMNMHDRFGLPVCILRPGVVVGEGGTPFHSGLGIFNNDQHCIGWNDGRNPLPFVLVDDVADAIMRACTAAGIDGKAFNLVGDVRLNAREYMAELARALGRPLAFYPKRPTSLWLAEVAKWGVKAVGGRRAPPISRRDLLSRGMPAVFDCSDVKRALDWRPVADREIFIDQAIRVHAR